MNTEEINKKIQIEKDSYARDLNRLQQEIFKLKQRHQRTMEYWQRQKETRWDLITNKIIVYVIKLLWNCTYFYITYVISLNKNGEVFITSIVFQGFITVLAFKFAL